MADRLPGMGKYRGEGFVTVGFVPQYCPMAGTMAQYRTLVCSPKSFLFKKIEFPFHYSEVFLRKEKAKMKF